MDYALEFNGRAYDLPKFTQSVSDEIGKINKRNEDPKVQDADKYKTMYDFIRKMVGSENAAEIFGTENVNEIDLNEITICYLGICNGYDKPVNEFKREKNQIGSQISEEDKRFVLEVLKNSSNLEKFAKMSNVKTSPSSVERFAI